MKKFKHGLGQKGLPETLKKQLPHKEWMKRKKLRKAQSDSRKINR